MRVSVLRGLLAASVCGALLSASATELAASDVDDTPRESNFADQARSPSYADYAAQLGSGWKQFEKPNLERMRAWWKDHAPAHYSTVLYPFSGPDIANALALFPDADSYLLFGLEPPGSVPDLHALDDEAIKSGMNELKASLSEMLQVNYFFTKSMEKKLGTGSFNSVSGLLVFFLAMSDREVTSTRPVAIGNVPGVEITFTRHGGREQTLRYFMVNVADANLAKSAPDFIPYLESQGRFATMIKSASYLLHKEGNHESMHFEQIRALILGHSDLVVQDDSGVPLRDFSRDTWKLQFAGQYTAPTPEFGKYLQKDLRVEMQRSSTGKLPFAYGYAYKHGESNLMIAERRR